MAKYAECKGQGKAPDRALEIPESIQGPRLRQLLRSGFDLWASDQFFNWGEPLLNTHLEDFISLANSKNVLSAISTNLSLQLSDDRIRRLVTSGLREMIVSLDGASSET